MAVLMKFMHSLQLKSHVRALSTLVVASIALPALAYADREDKDSRAENHGRGDNDEHHAARDIPVVPEANAGWVLVPFFGAVLFFSTRQLFRGKVAE
jgi:hypothetical protein